MMEVLYSILIEFWVPMKLFKLIKMCLIETYSKICIGKHLDLVSISFLQSYVVIRFFNWPNPSNRTMALGSTQPLTEMSTRNLPGGKGRPACKADNLTDVYEPTV
jgi:hypothetical protein